MSSVKVNTDRLDEIAEELKKLNREIKSVEDSLQSVRTGITSCVSLANKGYPGKVSTVRTNLHSLETKVTGLARKLDQIAALYAACEKDVVKLGNSPLNGRGFSKEDVEHMAQAATVLTTIANTGFRIKDIINALKKGKKYGEYLNIILGGDPVNLASGNFLYDLDYLGHDTTIPMRVRLFYNGMDELGGVFGRGWRHNFESRLVRDNNTVYVTDEDGEVSVFQSQDGVTFVSDRDVIGNLEIRSDGSWVWMDRERIRHFFDDEGNIQSLKSDDGYEIRFFHENGNLVRACDNFSNSYEYQYDENGNLIQVSDQGGRQVAFGYAEGKLTSITDPNGDVLTFSYDKEGRLEEVRQPDGTIGLKNHYDDRNRVTIQDFPDGTSTSFEYDEEKNTVTQILQDGSRSVYQKDDRARIVSVTDADGTESYTYNDRNQRLSETDRRGARTEYAYDSFGNISQVLDALGGDFRMKWKGIRQPLEMLVNGQTLVSASYDPKKDRIISETDGLGGIKKYEYDPEGRLVALITPNGLRNEMTYGEDGRIASVTDPATGKVEYTYDASGRVISTENALGHKYTYSYDQNDHLTSLTDAEGNTVSFSYDSNGRLVREEKENGGCTEYRYDNMGRMTAVTDPDGKETTFSYDCRGNLICRKEADGTENRCEYDFANRVVKRIYPDGTYELYGYDANGNQTSRTARDGALWKVEYDALNRATAVIDPMGVRTEADYDAFGHVTAIHYPDGRTEESEYDLLGRMVSYTNRAGYKVLYSYNAGGEPISISDDAGILVQFAYDDCGRLLREEYAGGNFSEYTYDAIGRITGLKSEEQELLISYDRMNRIVSAEQVNGAKESYEYDAAGNITAVIDGDGNRISREFSKAGALLSVTDALGNQTRYEYDDCYRLTSMIQKEEYPSKHMLSLPLQKTDIRRTRYERDACGRVKRIVNPDDTEIRFFYDACGRLNREIDEAGNEISTEYRPDGKAMSAKISDGRAVSWEYNELKQVTRLTDWLGTMSIERDPLGNPLTVTDQNNRTVRYERNASGRATKITYPDGKMAEYSYGPCMRLEQIRTEGHEIRYSYDSIGRLNGVSNTEGINGRFTYDDNGNLRDAEYTNGGLLLEKIQYAFDHCGRRKQITRSGADRPDAGVYDYVYDVRGMLSEVHKDGRLLERYSYDRYGNRVEKSGAEGTTSYSYDRMNHLIKESTSTDEKTFRYDPRGNLTAVMSDGREDMSFQWDALNRLSRADHGNESAEYTYNGLQLRASAKWNLSSGCRKEEYIYDIQRPYANQLSRECERVTENLIWGNSLEAILSSGGISHVIDDPIMTPWRKQGAEDRSFSWSAFGQMDDATAGSFRKGLSGIFGEGSFAAQIGFAGYRMDPITGLLSAGYREYDPVRGRYISADRVGSSIYSSAMLSPYVYCLNDPLDYVDPDGQIPTILVGAAVGAVKNVAVMAGSDMVKAICGQPVNHTWMDYAGTALGGATSGALIATGVVDPKIANAAGEAVSTLSTNGMKMAAGVEGYRKEDGYNAGKLAMDTLKSGGKGYLSSFAFDSIAKNVKIPGITSGRHSALSDFKRQMTRSINHGTKLGVKTLRNGLLGVGVGSFAASAKETFADIIKEEPKKAVCRMLNKKLGLKCSASACCSGGGSGGGGGKAW
uniref:Rhs family protein n=1 Tax=Eubacterium cellulosolvens (strain ATCC 43171 / JCM 9499 / 6) TaxID=633697 RepID=I5AXE2_EUBC6